MSGLHVLVGLLTALCGLAFWSLPERQAIPAHMKNHPVVDVGQGFLKPETVDGLLAMSRKIGRIRTASREYDTYSTLADNIGEAVPFDKKSGKCPQLFLMPNGDMSKCVFPGRSDVGSHYVKSGGIEARKERLDTLIARVQPFQTMLWNWSEFPVATKLMEDKEFVDLARAVCPAGKQFIDPFQFNLVVQVPGQTVAAHIDAPVFLRGTRNTLPQWLLAVMVFSGLFQDDFVPQVQLVGYYHKWTDNRGGKFYFWSDNSTAPHESDPVTGSANSVDGSKVVHAAGLYMPDRKPPPMSKDTKNELIYIGVDEATGRHRWGVEINGKVAATYDEDEIRFSAVYRMRCFADAAEKAAFEANIKQRPWSVEDVLHTLEKDMKVKGAWPFDMKDTAEARNTPEDRYTLGMALMSTYIKYPYSPTAAVPFNYCALERLVPALKPLLELVC